MLRWGFIGVRDLALRVLKKLMNEGFYPSLIITMPNLAETAEFQAISEKYGIPFDATHDLLPYQTQFKTFDFALVCRYHRIATEIFSLPRWGFFNIHPSLLPAYRGIHPISWALIHGETLTGITIHQMSDVIDAGPIIEQIPILIQPEHNIETLTRDLNRLAASMSVELLRTLTDQQKPPKTRPQKGTSSYARRRTEEDSKIVWDNPAHDIYNLSRALIPLYTPPFCFDEQNQKIQILECQLTDQKSTIPGSVSETHSNQSYLVDCRDQKLLIKTSVPLNLSLILR